MSCECHERIGGRFNGLYRDRDNGWFFGVCAGIAHYFDIQILAVRIVALISLLLFTVPTALVYIVASLLLKQRSLGNGCHCDERRFWRSGRDYRV
ncbi:MAG: PspC domain-containing protein [Pseudomonadota bacterium]